MCARAFARRRRNETLISKHSSTGLSEAGFAHFNLRPELLRAVVDAGYTSPRPIQAMAVPPAIEGHDVLGLAQTGTGKTAAFVLPILHRLLGVGSAEPRGARERKTGPRALVVAPTRELAAQVHSEFERLAVHTQLSSTPIFGGVPIPRQVRALAQRPDVVVACPGRLLDLLSQGALRLDAVEVLVLDEADHMFDMGFLPDVRRILRALPAVRQNLMFSATMPPEIRKLANSVLRKPTVVELGNSRPAETIEHAVYALAEVDKVGALQSLLGGEDFRSAIVFLRTKRRAKRLAQRLSERGHAAVSLEGNMSQPQRERALQGFRDGRFDVLVATDIAARGLDIAGVSHVVNFDVPNTPDAYTHRIGRTGRSEQSGRAFTFVTTDDSSAVRAIEKRLGAPIERRDPSELGRLERITINGPKERTSPKSFGGGRTRRTARPEPAFSRSPRKSAPKSKPAGARRHAAATPTAVQRSTPAAAAAPARPAHAFGVGVLDSAPAPRGERARTSAADSQGAHRGQRRGRRRGA